jgi:hypothetical protein
MPPRMGKGVARPPIRAAATEPTPQAETWALKPRIRDSTQLNDGTPLHDAAADAGTDAACAAGQSRCANGCIALDAATSCGSCTNDCSALSGGAHVVNSGIGCSNGRCTYTCVSGHADCADSGAGCATNLQDAAANCGTCGRDCNRASCAAAMCGAYVIAQQPTTGTVAKLATDGTRVIWSDTGTLAIMQIAATGGTAITLASASSTYAR